MTAAGVIAEYNPFHLGHAWQLARTRDRLGDETGLVCVMSGHWVQGADCAVADKWTRAGLALRGGADLILELPTPFALSSAESFARGGVALLEATGVVDVLSFGSECGDIDRLAAAARILDGADYRRRLKEALAQGLSFPAARQEAAGCPCLSAPNNNLGVEYLRALNALGSAIRPMTVPRRGAGHGTAEVEEGFASATQIRRLLRGGQTGQAGALLPPGTLDMLGEPSSLTWVERGILARLRNMTAADWSALPDSGAAEGLPDRLANAARQARYLKEYGLLALYTAKRQHFLEGLDKIGLKHNIPQGTYFVMVDIQDFLDLPRFAGYSDLEFCEWMIREIGVAAVPGSSFFREPVNHLIRLHFARSEETIDEALRRLSRMAALLK